MLTLYIGSCINLKSNNDSLTILIEQDINTLDPRLAITSYENKISRLIFKSLVSVDNEKLLPEFELADSIKQISPIEYKVCLKKNVYWQDLENITSEDIIYTFNSIKSPSISSPFQQSFSYIKSISKIDKQCVIFNLNHPRASFVFDLVIPLLPSHILLNKNNQIISLDNEIIGSGYFKYKKKVNNKLIFESKISNIKKLIIQTIRDDNTRALIMFGGGADISINNIPPYLWSLFLNNKDLHSISSFGIGLTYIGFNLENRYLKDIRVRKAIALAIDRNSIIKGKFKNRAIIASSIFPPIHWAFDKNIVTYEYNIKKAKEYLDEAGFIDPDGSGNMPRLVLTYKTSPDKFRISIAKIIAYYLKKVGIEVEVRSYEFGTLLSKLNRGDFELISLQLPQIIEPNILTRFFHSKSIPSSPLWNQGSNRWRYSSSIIDELLEKGEVELNFETRRDIYIRIQNILSKELPIFPLWHENNVAIVNKRVKSFNLLPSAPFNFYNITY